MGLTGGRDRRLYYNELVDMLRKKYEGEMMEWIGTFEHVSQKLINREVGFRNVFMIDVIEHLKDSRSTLRDIRDLLLKGGKAFFVTDSGDHLTARGDFLAHREHLNVFTEKSFKRLLSDFTESLSLDLWWNSPQGSTFVVLRKI